MKKFKHFLKKYWISVLLVLSLAFLFGGLAFAKYSTEHNAVKRVIATDSGAGKRFTSNYLFTGDGNQQVRNVASTYIGDIAFDLYVYNYSSNNPLWCYPTDLDYTMSFIVTNKNGEALSSEQVEEILGNDSIIVNTVTEVDGEEVKTLLTSINKDHLTDLKNLTIVHSSAGGTNNRFELVLPHLAIGENIRLQILATPAAKHRDISDIVLSSRFGADFQTIVLTTGWTGSYNDNTQLSPGSYEGFNYSIVGSGNSSGKLYWRDDLLELNKNEMRELFGINLPADIQHDSLGTYIELNNLSSDNNAGRYDFQIYIKDKAAKTTISSMDWNAFSQTCIFVENEN